MITLMELRKKKHLADVDELDDANRIGLRERLVRHGVFVLFEDPDENAVRFIGAALEVDEVTRVVDYMRDLVEEPAGFVIGARQRRAGRCPERSSSRGRRP